MATTYNNLFLDTRARLKKAGVESAQLEAREIICFAADKSREQFYRDMSLYVSGAMEQRVEELVQRRLAGEPVAYIIGEWEFYGLSLDISRDVLIPRLDTELLAERGILKARESGEGARVLDLCAGSGCVGLAIAANAPECRVVLAELAEGALRILIFVGYLLMISQMEDIRRVFMYHGAEHKCINCIEHGLDLTLENVRNSSREHKRCGTSFLFVVIIVSVIATMFIRADSRILRLLLRLAIIPLIAGVSYEFIRLAGRSENPIVNLLSKPGMLLQRLTTREPDEEMIEVGIASVEAVFDWKPYVEKLRNGK